MSLCDNVHVTWIHVPWYSYGDQTIWAVNIPFQFVFAPAHTRTACS